MIKKILTILTLLITFNSVFSLESIKNISVSKYENGQYLQTEKLGNEINSDSIDLDPIVAFDESYLIFHSRRSGEEGEIDLYNSFKDTEN